MKIIFLDFDGVVTAKNQTPGSYITHSNINYGPTPICVECLLNLVKKTDAKIVISSNWRKFDESGNNSIWKNPLYGDICNPLPKFIPMLKDGYLETLPPIRHKNKAIIAEQWLLQHNNIESFIAFDDMCEYEGYCSLEIFKNKYINTDPETGITDKDCEKAFLILNGNNT
jgi:hypothetical protein